MALKPTSIEAQAYCQSQCNKGQKSQQIVVSYYLSHLPMIKSSIS